MRVTVLGTGIMGTALTRTLIRDGHTVTAWNRTAERAEPLREDGAQVVTPLDEAVKDADAVIVALFDADAVCEVLERAMPAAPDTVWLQGSTIGLAGTRRVEVLARRHDAALLEMMMLGTKAPAEQGKLTLLVSGDESLDARVAPVFEAISAKVVRVGPAIGQATALKLVTNAWVGSITAAAGQSIALAQGLGLEPELFLQAIDATPVDSPYAHVKGKAMIARDFPASFPVGGVVKDLGVMIEAAEEVGMRTDLLTTVRSLFQRASDHGHKDDDMAAVVTSFPAG